MNKKLITAAMLAGLSTQASAFIVDTGDSDWSIRWDNSLKYNIAVRTANRDRDVYGDSSGTFAADPDASFDRGEIISNRVDLLSELDVIWNDTAGFRVSGAGWYDHAYRNGTNAKGAGTKDAGPFNTSENWSTGLSAEFGELNDEEDFLHYRGAELLDAFVFWNWSIGETQGNLRAGRHVIYWGQSLLGTAAVVSAGASMNPLDLSKALSVPGSEVKELFRPTNKVSTLIQLTDELTMSAYYSFEWEATRLPRGNSFFSPAAGFTDHVDLVHLPPAFGGGAFLVERDEEPGDGEWGIQFSYWFEDLGMEAQVYYINYHDKIQNGLQACLYVSEFALGDSDCTAGGPVTFTNLDDDVIANRGKFKWTYKEDVRLYGFSLSKQIGAISYGMDLTYREDAALRPHLLNILGRTAAGYTAADYEAADESDFNNATGDTVHLVINALGLLNDNGWWEGGSYIIEATFGTILKADELHRFVLAQPTVSGGDRTGDLNADEDRISSHLAINFSPTWYQVTPGVDMTVRATVSVGIDGTGYASFAGDEESGSASLGVDFLVDQTWSWSVKYNAFFGPVPNSFGNLIKDRDNVSLTFKRTF